MAPTTSTRGPARSRDERMMLMVEYLRWIGGRTNMEKRIMAGPEAMRGTASWLGGSDRPPRLIGADA